MHVECLQYPHDAHDIGDALGYIKILELIKTLLAGRDQDITMRSGLYGKPAEGDFGGHLSFLI